MNSYSNSSDDDNNACNEVELQLSMDDEVLDSKISSGESDGGAVAVRNMKQYPDSRIMQSFRQMQD